ncbi:MAG: hypothetical protein E6G39_00110 [Actinobacteria bacterium]|nr:MAG: hypothetical protein E6G39_00110 [Actinomycetota bacterium]
MTIDGTCPARVEGSTPRRGRSWPLKVYVAGIVAVVVVAAGANVVYQRTAALDDARESAAADATFGARIAAPDIAAAVGLARTTVSSTAANPGIAKVFDAPTGCTLSFGGVGAFATGHLDVVAPNGTVACSSLAVTPSSGYGGEQWLTAALEKPTFVGPVIDARTGKQVVLASSPITGMGAVVAFLDLDALGPGLASRFGGPRRLEFVVTRADDRVVLARSIDAASWVGASTDNTPFAGITGDVGHRDLDGAARLYGQATVDGLDWKVFAGASKTEALAAASRLSNRELAVSIIGLIVFLAATWLIYRRVARPRSSLLSTISTN